MFSKNEHYLELFPTHSDMHLQILTAGASIIQGQIVKDRHIWAKDVQVEAKNKIKLTSNSKDCQQYSQPH